MAGLSRLRRDRHLLPHWSSCDEYTMLEAMHRYVSRMRRATLDNRIKRMHASVLFVNAYWRGYHESKRSK